MDKKHSVKTSFFKFIFLVFILLISYSLYYFFVLQRPFYISLKNKIFDSLNSNFEFKFESVNNFFVLIHDEGILVTSRTKIREKLVLYNADKTDFEELKNYTYPKLNDVIRFSENIKGIVRFTLNKENYIEVGKKFDKKYWIIPEYNSKKINYGFLFKIDNKYYYNILFPIIDPKYGLAGYDLVFYDIKYLINSFKNKNNIDHLEYTISLITKMQNGFYFIPQTQKILNKELTNLLNRLYIEKPFKNYKFHDNSGNVYILKILVPYNVILSFKLNEISLYKAILIYFKRSIISFFILIIVVVLVLYIFSRPFFNKYFITLTELESKINEKNKELLKEKEIFRNYLDISPIIIVVLDNSGNIEYINETGLKLMEYSSEEIIGKNWFEIAIPENELELVKKNFNQIITGNLNTVKNFTNRIKTKNNKFFIINWTNTYLKDNKGNIIATFSAGLNITETKEKEKQIEFILSSVNSFLWQIKIDSINNIKPTYYSQGIKNLVGYSATELLNRNPSWLDIVLEEDKEIIYRSRKNMLNFTSGVDEYRIKTKSGKILWIKSWYYPLEIYNEIYVNGFAIDITYEKELEQWYSSIIKALSYLNIGYLIYKANDVKSSKIISVNKAFERLTGYKKEEVINKVNPLDLISKEYRELAKQRFEKRIKKENTPSHYEIEILRKDGTQFIADLNITLMDNNGEKYIFALFRDITEKVKREQNLLAKQKLEAIGILASGIAHDFNNILGGIFGWVSLLENIIVDKEQLKMLREIKNAGNRAAELISKLLGFARKGKYENKIINLNTQIKNVVDIIKPTLKKNIEIELNLENDIKLIEGDSNQIQQVIMNLCVNGAQAMPDGGKLTISTKNFIVTEKFASTHFNILPGEYVLLSVDDTGIGMYKETMEHIFEPFFTTKKDKGTGLGLSTVYGIVKNHNGIITVYSEINKGTSFKIYLPVTKIVKPKEQEKLYQNNIIKGEGTILIVDDEEMIRSVYSKMLKLIGYNILTATNGYKALKIFEKKYNEIDLVILDLNMPEMDGEVTFDKLKNIKPDIKIILATGFAINGTVQKLLDKGADAYIKKPFDIEELSEILQKVMERK